MKTYDVYLDGKLIDTIFFDEDATLDEVRDSLIHHDFQPHNIVVIEQKETASTDFSI